jgi:hypothetical protein
MRKSVTGGVMSAADITDPASQVAAEGAMSDSTTNASQSRQARSRESKNSITTLTNRTIEVLADELRCALTRETKDILAIGELLLEAKAKVGHGKWLSWLKEEVSMSDRSAAKYMKAAEFAAKFELDSNLNVSPSALYLLSEDGYWENERWRKRLPTRSSRPRENTASGLIRRKR